MSNWFPFEDTMDGITVEDSEWCECPYCHVRLRSYRNDDPLKKHMEFCNRASREDE